MARKTFRAALGADLGDGQFTISAGPVRNPSDDVATLAAAITTAQGAHKTAVDDAVNVLVADGATPTQAHVTTLAAAWTTLKADVAALSATAATASTAGDFQVSYDAAVVTNFNAFRRLVDALLRQVRSSGMV